MPPQVERQKSNYGKKHSTYFQALEDSHLNIVNYLVLFFAAAFVVVGLPITFGLSEPVGQGNGVEVDGMWQATFVTFLVYAMMPLKTWVALAFSSIIAATHMSIAALMTENRKIDKHWQQVSYLSYFLHS